MRKGVVVGKFYPPHRGHKFLIDTALQQVDHLTVMVCDNPSQTIPASLRAAWLQEIHPNAHVVVVPDDLPDDDSSAWARRTIEVIGEKPDVVFTSEDYGVPYSEALGCEHVQVDKARATIPISATQIRANPLAQLEFLEPPVRVHYIPRICIVGAESTGKTTLAQLLAAHYDCEWIAEYGREYSENKIRDEHSEESADSSSTSSQHRSPTANIQSSTSTSPQHPSPATIIPSFATTSSEPPPSSDHPEGMADGSRCVEARPPELAQEGARRPPEASSDFPTPKGSQNTDPPNYGEWTTDEFLHIAQTQLGRENEAARRATRLIICDTDAFATGVWHERYMGHVSEDVNKIGRDHNTRIYLIPDPDVPFVQDGWRDGEHVREWMHARFLEELPKLSRPYHLLTGDYDTRLQQAIAIIDVLLCHPEERAI